MPYDDNNWTCRYCGAEYTACEEKADCDNCGDKIEPQSDGTFYDHNSGEYKDPESPSDWIDEDVSEDPDGNEFWDDADDDDEEDD